VIHLAFCTLLATVAHADTVSGDSIAATVSKDLTPFKACYDANAKPGAAGKVVTRFTVGADGKVSKAEIASSELKNEKLETCVLDALRALTFTAPSGAGVQVEYPFVFKPEAKAKAKKPKS
jgi:TonB family protein